MTTNEFSDKSTVDYLGIIVSFISCIVIVWFLRRSTGASTWILFYPIAVHVVFIAIYLFVKSEIKIYEKSVKITTDFFFFYKRSVEFTFGNGFIGFTKKQFMPGMPLPYLLYQNEGAVIRTAFSAKQIERFHAVIKERLSSIEATTFATNADRETTKDS